MTRGYFITFEGGEGAGKTTQIQNLASFLTSNNKDIVITREPGGTPTAEAIRDLVFSVKHDGNWSPQAETLMMFAARAMHIKDVIKPAIDAGKVVICDRYLDSTRVYQGTLNNVSLDFIKNLEQEIIGSYRPNLTFVLDVPAEIAMKRVQERGAENNNDRGNLEFYQKLRDGFLTIAQNEPDRCIPINAHNDEDLIAQEIQAIVLKRLT